MIREIWFAVAGVNLIAQVWYFFADENRMLYAAKRITTPLLLLLAFVFSLINRGGLTLIPGTILLAMGLGEIGIEGSSVVQSTPGNANRFGRLESLVVTAAGVIFLLVNVVLGSYVWRLAVESGLPGWEGIAAGMGISALVLSGVLLTTIRIRRPEKTIVSQMVIYAIGLWVLFAGTLISIFAGALMSVVVQAGAILSVSDTLVLIRMGAGWKKESMGQRRTLLAFLIIILLLYYWFMYLMMGL
jgi:hypothetical protein